MSEKYKKLLFSPIGLSLLFLAWCLFVTNLWLPRNWGFYGNNDWDLTYSVFEAARKSIVEFGQWPQFNPYAAFGTDLIANPQSTHISIFFIPICIFGTFYGYKVSILLSIFIGLWGAYKFFQTINNDKIVALLAAFLFAGLNYFGEHIFHAGHSNVLYLYLVPWVLYFLLKLKSEFRWKYAIWPVLLLSQIIVGGAPIVFLITAIIILIWCVATLWIERNKTIVLPFILILVSGVILSFWKVWPGIVYWQDFPRWVTDNSGISIVMWLQSLAGYETNTGNWLAWWEYSLGFNLILLGIIYYYRKSIQYGWKWLVLFGLVVWLSLGNTPPFINIWYPLNKFFPIFSSLRAPSRFGFIAVFGLLVALVYCIKNSKEISFLHVLLFFAVAAQSLSFNAISKNMLSSKLFEYNEIQAENFSAVPEPIIASKEKLNYTFLEIKKNKLVLNAYEPLNAATIKDTVSQLISGAQLITFTPNIITLRATSTMVNLNLRYSDYWNLKGIGKITDKNGLIAIDGAKGDITLSYNNRHVGTGMLMSFLVFPCMFLVRLFTKKIRQ